MRIDRVPQTTRMSSVRRIALRIAPEAERSLRQGHPWLYAQAIRRQSHEGRPGDLAVLYDRSNRFLAVGLYDPSSPIRVRVLQRHRPTPIDTAWCAQRFAAAAQRREPLGAGGTTGWRIVHGENDDVPGLVLDRYEDTLVLKLYTAAWAPHLRMVLDALSTLPPARRVILRLSRSVNAQGLYGLSDGMIVSGARLTAPVVFQEHGLRFEADPIHGQKTGFFLDQRDNRARLERCTAGRTVLDVFAYTGGFSIHAARGGAREVTSLDASAPALTAARRNLVLNQHHPAVAAARHRVIVGDAFDRLARLAREHRRFDVVVVDPPAFAKTQREVSAALAAYARLTRLALGVLEPDGTLVIACCSGQVSDAAFFTAVHRAAASDRRPLRELERTGHPIDHPVGFPAGAYLKCLFATVPAQRSTIPSQTMRERPRRRRRTR